MIVEQFDPFTTPTHNGHHQREILFEMTGEQIICQYKLRNQTGATGMRQ